MSDLFAARRPTGTSSNSVNVKRWVRELFALADEVTVMVTELRCSEPGCPPLETVIAILTENGNRQHKLHKSIEEVAEDDVRSLVADAVPSIEPAKSEKGEN
jgi:hypothetical protein